MWRFTFWNSFAQHRGYVSHCNLCVFLPCLLQRTRISAEKGWPAIITGSDAVTPQPLLEEVTEQLSWALPCSAISGAAGAANHYSNSEGWFGIWLDFSGQYHIVTSCSHHLPFSRENWMIQKIVSLFKDQNTMHPKFSSCLFCYQRETSQRPSLSRENKRKCCPIVLFF